MGVEGNWWAAVQRLKAAELEGLARALEARAALVRALAAARAKQTGELPPGLYPPPETPKPWGPDWN